MAEKQMSLAKACELWNKDKKNEAAQEVIRDRIGHRAVIVLDASGQIVIPDTLENLDIAKSHPGNDEQADCVSPSKLFAAAQPKFKGDPIDRRLLRSSGVTATENIARTSPAIAWSQAQIAKIKGKCDANCALDTFYHRVATIATVVGTLTSTLVLQLSAKQVFLPTWASLGLTAVVLLVGAYSSYGAEMIKKHKYSERWTAMRPVLDWMIREEMLAANLYGSYAGLTAAQADGQLAETMATLVAEARGIK